MSSFSWISLDLSLSLEFLALFIYHSQLYGLFNNLLRRFLYIIECWKSTAKKPVTHQLIVRRPVWMPHLAGKRGWQFFVYCFLYLCTQLRHKFVSFGSYHLLIDAYLQFNKDHVRQSCQLLTWLSINQNSLWYRISFSPDKNLSVVVKLLLCHSCGCPVIHEP